jgi:hypothetical protein
MIHQFIFAGPKPGLSADAFQSYWLHFHAVDYAAKIPQIKQYLVAPRIQVQSPREVPFFQGVAEIWLQDEPAQIASLQSSEYLLGARLDEPRWAAFWQTFVHEADSEVLWESAEPLTEGVKVYVFLKRRPDLSLEAFQAYMRESHYPSVLRLPNLHRLLVGFARPNLYGFGEPVQDSWTSFCDDRFLFTFVGQENWIISPGER